MNNLNITYKSYTNKDSQTNDNPITSPQPRSSAPDRQPTKNQRGHLNLITKENLLRVLNNKIKILPPLKTSKIPIKLRAVRPQRRQTARLLIAKVIPHIDWPDDFGGGFERVL